MKATSCINLSTTFHVDYQQHQKSNSPTVCLIVAYYSIYNIPVVIDDFLHKDA